MYLQTGEKVVKIFRHHPLFFIIRFLKSVIASFPFFFVNYVFQGLYGDNIFWLLNWIILIIFVVVIIYDMGLYFLDSLVITNLRVVYREWHTLFKNEEIQAFLNDIQDIRTVENGVFSLIPLFDFGSFTLETASTKTVIEFEDTNNPEGIKQFVYSLAKTGGEIPKN